MYEITIYLILKVDRLREKLKEKETDVESKDKLVTNAQTDKKRVEAELAELRDHMDIKDRKINVLQRKVSPGTLLFLRLLYSTKYNNMNNSQIRMN